MDLNTGATAPVADEVDLQDLKVIGRIPNELDGTLVRNGPNPLSGRFNGNDVLSWWPEDAMLHRISFRDARASCYANRWLRTRRWANARDPDSAAARPDTNPNVNVIRHAGEVLALSEGGAPLAIDRELRTLGAPERHRGPLIDAMTAHPKIDPHTGELIVFRAHWQRPYLRYGVIDATGAQVTDIEIDLPSPCMMHDMAITASYSLFLDTNVAYDFSMLSKGHRMPLRWHEERSSRIGLIARHGGAVRWFEIAPCFIQHVVNAYDAGESVVVLHAIRYPSYFRLSDDGAGFEDPPLGVLWRYVIDLRAGIVSESQLDDAGIELPRVNEARTGRDHRYFYAVQQPSNTEMRGIARYDLLTGAKQHHELPMGDQNSEPVFVPRPGATDEDDGWLLTCVYRGASDTSDVLILDARDIESEPVAIVRLPRRIPAGFHGAWLPAE